MRSDIACVEDERKSFGKKRALESVYVAWGCGAGNEILEVCFSCCEMFWLLRESFMIVAFEFAVVVEFEFAVVGDVSFRILLLRCLC